MNVPVPSAGSRGAVCNNSVAAERLSRSINPVTEVFRNPIRMLEAPERAEGPDGTRLPTPWYAGALDPVLFRNKCRKLNELELTALSLSSRVSRVIHDDCRAMHVRARLPPSILQLAPDRRWKDGANPLSGWFPIPPPSLLVLAVGPAWRWQTTSRRVLMNVSDRTRRNTIPCDL